MSWASRRRGIYALGVIVFFALLIGIPLARWYFTISPTCFDGKRNQGETAIDKGGPCALLDERQLSPSAVLWSRAFLVHPGAYSAVAYIQNVNEHAGVRTVRYQFGLYDDKNILVAERTGTTSIMPGGVTPIFEGNIETGNRIVTHTYFEFLDALVWERMEDTSRDVVINDRSLQDINSAPRLSATAENTAIRQREHVEFVAVIFDAQGNAFAASQTILPRLDDGEKADIVFTWPTPFNTSVGRVDIIPKSEPLPDNGT